MYCNLLVKIYKIEYIYLQYVILINHSLLLLYVQYVAYPDPSLHGILFNRTFFGTWIYLDGSGFKHFEKSAPDLVKKFLDLTFWTS